MAEVLVEEETVLVVSGFLVKMGTIPRELVILDEEEKMVPSSDALVATWRRPLGLARLGGIGTCLGTSGLCRFASLLLK